MNSIDEVIEELKRKKEVCKQRYQVKFAPCENPFYDSYYSYHRGRYLAFVHALRLAKKLKTNLEKNNV